MSFRFRTVYVPNYIDIVTQNTLYNSVCETFKNKWRPGPRSSRLATAQPLDAVPGIYDVVTRIMQEYLPESAVYNVYYNLYLNGSMYTPNHSHPDTLQIIISLGPGIRTLNVGKKPYIQSPGTLTIFGSSTHGVPKEPHIIEPRIGVAIFCTRPGAVSLKPIPIQGSMKGYLMTLDNGDMVFIQITDDTPIPEGFDIITCDEATLKELSIIK